ncbi:MAG: hypothetical protein JNG84_12850 [Archangium sp.]|nr:hypothetical protein [Archangium sp.]
MVRKHEDVGAALRFVADIDERLCRLDAESMMLRVQRASSSPLVRVVARVADERGHTCLLATELGQGCGLLWRPDAGWQWLEGDAEVVLEHLPEPHLRTAAARISAQALAR